MKFFKTKKQSIMRVLCAVLAVSMLIPVAFGAQAVSAETASAADSTIKADYENKYSTYLKANADKAAPDASIKISAAQNFTAIGGEVTVGDFGSKKNVLLWKSDNGEVTWTFNVAKAGNYHLRLNYYSLNENAKNIQIGMKLDGKEPFFEAQQLAVLKHFKSANAIVQDERGNDIRPKQVTLNDWVTSSLRDFSGTFADPYSFYLSAGTHTITFVGSLSQWAIDYLEFYNATEAPSYADYSAGKTVSNLNYKEVYEGETPIYTSSATVYPTYDRTSPDTSPSHPVKMRYNIIGGSNYSAAGQFVVWEVEAPEDGYYHLGARIRQNIQTGMVSYRRLYVNGEVPFKEAENIKFRFDNKWQDYVFGGEETPWLIHLNKGKNQIKLEVVTGDMAQIIFDLQNLVTEVNAFYREIIMITSASPDTYRDYHLESEIKDYYKHVQAMMDESQRIYDEALALGNKASGNFSALDKLIGLFERFIEDPEDVPSSVSTLNSYASGVSSLMSQVKSHPLEIDTITVATDVKNIKTRKVNFFQNVAFQFKSFIGSFTEDYSTIGTEGKTDTEIRVWVSLGRDQANALKTLADSSFTPKTGVSVKVSLVTQSLVQASLSGYSPDVVLFVGEAEPVNLAMRGGLVGLKDFKAYNNLEGFADFNGVKSRFQPTAMDAYFYEGDYYAVPITQTFTMMFYRTDILRELGVTPPKTWEELYQVIRVLQHKNLTVGIPNANASNVMLVDLGVFHSLLRQSGEKLYADDFASTNLDSEIGIDVFGTWTDFYKTYGLPYQYDFFNRFRSGDMPIGLSAYTMYGQLKMAAPEIDGLWEMTGIPGTVKTDADGKTYIDNSVNAGTACGLIMAGSKHKEEAWAFLDWFTSADSQTQFGQEIEALLGPSGRFATANVEALGNLPWTYQEQQIITEQWNKSFTINQIPGSYFLERNLINAFRKVVFSSNNSRETILSYNKTIENEIERKRKEFGLAN